jgi:nicotinamide-nucleotide amidase
MKSAVLSTGTELTRGELVNTNAAWLSEQLTSLGLDVCEHCTVDDDETRIVDSLRRLGESVDVLVCTGGLGPTTDDITAVAVAKALGVGLVRDDASIEHIRRIYERLGRTMSVWNEKQADLPEGSTVLPNANGTAPGFSVKLGRAQMFFMPGVPREMTSMFSEQVVPVLAGRIERRTHQIHLRTLGLGESDIQQRLADLESSFPGVTVGYRATFPEVEIKVHARAESEALAEELAARAADVVRTRLAEVVYGEREDTYVAVLGRELRNRNLALAVAESCTGGLLGSMLTSVPGSSDYLVLDVVAYANSAKTAILGVAPELLRGYGSVSAEVAQAMAEGALRVSEADLAVSITGIAGPGGGSEEKPVGTVHVALARRGYPTETQARLFPGDRDRIRLFAAYTALRMISEAIRR